MMVVGGSTSLHIIPHQWAPFQDSRLSSTTVTKPADAAENAKGNGDKQVELG